jgi:hypothetical protein
LVGELLGRGSDDINQQAGRVQKEHPKHLVVASRRDVRRDSLFQRAHQWHAAQSASTSKMRASSSVSATLTTSPVSGRRSNYEVRFND